ncbi:MAG: zinc ribbon domain-containing protein [Desulfobacteraceae bacterium]|nr:MAG: zinc ribbon domain-containing protein [Desulfobacteraceae bacterium]
MPIFEYKCNQCEKIFEELIFSSAEQNQVICPKCGAKDPAKLMSSFASLNSADSSIAVGNSGSCGGNAGPFT